ncbi:MAG: hypothetical protein Q9175_001714 [Cornicularia normoerica]
MSFLSKGNMTRNPAAYLFNGLFPNLARYLSGGPRYLARANLSEGITEPTIEKGLPAEQLVATRFISPHPLVNFAEVPAIFGVQLDVVFANYVIDIKRPLLLWGVASPCFKSFKAETKSSSTEGSFDSSTQATSASQQPPEIEAESSSAEGSFGTSGQLWRPDMSAGFDFELRKRLHRHSVPNFPLIHTRDVSNSSNETLLWSPYDPPSTLSPVMTQLGQVLQDTAEKIIGEKQIDKVLGLEEVIRELRLELADQTERAEELETDLEICERDREVNFNAALRLYRTPGNLGLVERRNLIDQIHHLKFEIWNRDSQIQSRDQLIEALRLDVALFANQEQWVLLQQCYYALQQQYGQMPQDFRELERKYEDLQDEHIDVFNGLKKLEGDHTELKVRLAQTQEERDRLEDDAETSKRSSAEAASRCWGLEVQRDQILEQKAESEKEARANELFLAELAARMFKRTIFLAGVLDGVDVNPRDDEQMALCHLASEHLGLNAMEISNTFEIGKARARGDSQIEEERDESGVPETYAGELSTSISTSESNNYEPTIPIAEANDSSMIVATDEKDVPESPTTFDARRRREVAAAEEEILGPLGLGFEDGSPTLKIKPIPDNPNTSQVSRVMGLFPTSPDTPSKILGGLLTSGVEDMDQVTPARTGGTSGIARDQWNIAGDDLQEFTEVFRGPRTQPINIVSPGVGTKEAEDGNRTKEKITSQNFEAGAFLSTNEEGADKSGLVEEMGVGSDFDNAEDGAVIEGENAETGEPQDYIGVEDNGHDSAAVLKEFIVPGGHEGSFDSEPRTDSQNVTSSSTLANGKSSDIWKETSFGNKKQEAESSDYQNPSTASPAAALKLESSGGFVTIKSLPTTPLGESSPMFKDLGVSNGAISEKPNAIPSLFEETFNAPRSQDFFIFGASSGAVPFNANENTSAALPDPSSVPASTGIFSFSSTSLAQAPSNAYDPPRFEQDFAFGGSNGVTSFTASHTTSASQPALAPEAESARGLSVLATSLVQNIPTVIEEKAPKEEIAAKDVVKKEGAEKDALGPNMRGKKMAKRKKAQEEPKVRGPNRNQRRAASRERKAAEKKAKAVARGATARGRNAVAVAMMSG